jgi:hypothetical protein
VYATGTSVALSRGRSKLLLTYRRRVRAGRYTLTLRIPHGHGWRTRRQTITIRE